MISAITLGLVFAQSNLLLTSDAGIVFNGARSDVIKAVVAIETGGPLKNLKAASAVTTIGVEATVAVVNGHDQAVLKSTFPGALVQAVAASAPDLQRSAESVGMLVARSRLYSDSSGLRLGFYSNGIANNLCRGTELWTEPVAGYCSAFLVDSTHAITAAHCLPEDENDLAGLAVVFGLSDALNFNSALSDVFEIVGLSSNDGLDVAVITLNRPSSRRPLRLPEKAPSVGESVAVIGYPLGMAEKVSLGKIVSRQTVAFVRIAASTFAGNSGAPVVSLRDGTVIGVLLSGHRDFAWDPVNRCNVVFECGRMGECLGEDVLDIFGNMDILQPKLDAPH